MSKEHRITYSDMQNIVSRAKTNWPTTVMPMKISKRVTVDNEPAHVLMIESVLAYLNSHGLLNAFVKVDYDGQNFNKDA